MLGNILKLFFMRTFRWVFEHGNDPGQVPGKAQQLERPAGQQTGEGSVQGKNLSKMNNKKKQSCQAQILTDQSIAFLVKWGWVGRESPVWSQVIGQGKTFFFIQTSWPTTTQIYIVVPRGLHTFCEIIPSIQFPSIPFILFAAGNKDNIPFSTENLSLHAN